MRKVTKQAAVALITGSEMCQSNTEVKDGSMYLFGNKIAEVRDGVLFVSLCGWDTLTTKERLNGLCELWNGTRPFYAGADYPVHGWIEIGP